jgi:hypothetical protein
MLPGIPLNLDNGAFIIRAMTHRPDDGGSKHLFYQTTWRNISEDSHLHTRRRKNLKSYLIM